MQKDEAAWREEMSSRVQKIYAAELSGHFEVEEAVLFPGMERHLGRLELVAELCQDHRILQTLVERIRSLGVAGMEDLDEFSRVLEAHVRKEERRLFPLFEKRIPQEAALSIGREVEARLAKACPKL